MSNHKSSTQVDKQLPGDWAFISPAFGGLTGVVLGVLIANLVGIV